MDADPSPIITVGIHTEGRPSFEPLEIEGRPMVLLHNMLIGVGFHWQRSVEALLSPNLTLHQTPLEPTIWLTEHLPLEQYLQSVVASEMNPASPSEFVKAHTVISRSWALGKMKHQHMNSTEGKIFSNSKITDWADTSSHTRFDVCSDDHCQRYQGHGEVNSDVMRHVADTAGVFLADRCGNPADARFSKCCGGITELFSTCWQDQDPDYLVSKPDPYCNLSEMPSDERFDFLSRILKDYDVATTDFYRWKKKIDKQEVRHHLKEKFDVDLGNIREADIIAAGPSGRIKTLRILGDKGFIEISKELAVRRIFADSHLLSSAFTIEDNGDSFILHGKGWGHGVGLCQIGAARMAYEGMDYESILNFYYPGTHLSRELTR